MIDAKKYLEKKEKGLVSLAKVGNAHVLSWRRFDPETGKEVDSIVEAIDNESLKKLKKEASSLLAGIESMIKDVEAIQ